MNGSKESIGRELVFVGFNSRVAALDRQSGRELWRWKSRNGSGYVSLLLDGDRLIVSVQGYTYCLDPETGEEMWFNELGGMGTGVASLASARGGVVDIVHQAAAEEAARAAASNASSGSAG